ncbi:hypothetical protein BJF79_22555 [Actinomadura sp. CNU-125]|uniref:hypothetical protein n=1 Tax=Actinomadura sp. CNU-125 TaxID=1904961 RepID=UPI00095A6014|nr:hypothetical protein [Actinomadura sp. CNU-125]OLT12294.1 hypothetical protein BJF79_22555 [Actinomadura sp. CNU-125]
MTVQDDAPPSRTGPDGPEIRTTRSWAPHVWWISLLIGGVGAAVVWFWLPHGREIEAAWEMPAKLLVFAFACVGVALFPWASRLPHWALYLPFVVFTGYIVPRISGFYYLDGERAHGDSFYTHLYQLLYPGMVLTVAVAYRMGGGTSGRCLKIIFGGIVIIFSGFLDLMWYVVNPVGIPDEIDAPHINLITGGPISFGATVLFALAHVPIVVGFALLPLDRWIGRLLGTTGRPA